MLDQIIPTIAAIGGGGTYIALRFVSDVIFGVVDGEAVSVLSIIEKGAGGVTVGVVLFVLLRWVIKRNDKLTDEIRDMHETNNALRQQHYEKLEKLLTVNKAKE
jgi:hypothetical protein